MERKTNKSNKQKVIFASIHFLALLVSFWLLFFAGQNFLSKIFGRPEITSAFISRIIIFSCGLLYFIRQIFTLFVLIKREVPWSEVFGVGFFIAIIQILFAILTIYNKEKFSSVDWILIGIVIFGSYLNSGSELQRMIWKKKKENKGKLYTDGLFKYAMHINYLGDTILFSGFAFLTGSIWAFLVPVFITLGFIFYHIPELDKYLNEKYKEQFVEYKNKTRKFIPWIY